MNTRRILLSSLLALAAFQGTSYAALLKIGVSFIGRNNDQPLGVDDTAGVDAQTDWNNLGNNRAGEPTGNFSDTPINQTSGFLFTDDGLAGTRGTTGVTLSLTTNDSWNSDGPTGSNNEKLMKGIVKAQNNSTGTVTLHGLDPVKNYKFIAYTAENGAGANGDLQVTGATAYSTFFVQETNNFDGTFTRGISTNSGARDTNVDYVQWDTVSAQANGDLVFTFHHAGGTDGFGLAGIQLIELAPVIGPDKFWNFGAGTGVWDSATMNWRSTNDAGPSNATFANFERANFGDLGTAGARTVNVDPTNGVNPGEVVVNNAVANPYTIGGGAIKGVGNFIKDGPGTLTLTGANEFSGAFTVLHGTVNAASIGDPATVGNLGKGTLVVMGDTLGIGDAALNYTGPTATALRALNVVGNGGTFNVATAGQTLTMTNITGGGALIKGGPGGLTFTGTVSTATGGIFVTAGSLTVNTIGDGSGNLLSLDAGTSYTVTNAGRQSDGRALLLNGNATIGVTSATGSYTLRGDLNTSAVLTKTGNGRLELAGAVTFTQLPVISAGTLAITKDTANALPAGAINLGPNQRLEVTTGALTAANPITLSGGSLRVEQLGLQVYLLGGGTFGANQNAFTDAMNSSAYGVANYFAAASQEAGVTTTVVRSNANGVQELNFGGFNGNAPFSVYGVNAADDVRALFVGKIRIDTPGDTTFFTSSDDGSGIFIDGQRVVLNNAFQGNTTRQGTINLTAGLHDFMMYYAEGGGDAGLIADYTPAGGVRQHINNAVLTANNTEDFTATPITVTAPSTIDSGAGIASMGALTLPANTLLTLNGSALFSATNLTGGSAHQVAVNGFNANSSLGAITGVSNITKTGNGNLVFLTAPPAGTTIASNAGLVVAMGSNAGGDPLAGRTLTFNGGGFGMSSTAGDVTFTDPVTSNTNLTIAAGSFGNGNITTPTAVTFNPPSLVAPTGNTLTLRVNDGNFTMNITPTVTGTGNIITDEGKVNFNGGVNNAGGNFTNRAANATINGNLTTSALLQLGNQPNGNTAQNLGDNLIAGQFLPGSLTVTGTTSASSITTTRGTLSLNGAVTNTGTLTGNGNGTTNLGAISVHSSVALSAGATLNANATFTSTGALTVTGATANFNASTSASGVTLASNANMKVATTLTTGAGGLTANTNSVLRLDPGAGNTATIAGGDVSLDSRATVRTVSGTADLTGVAIHSNQFLRALNNNALGAKLIQLNNNGQLDVRDVNVANQIFNGTQTPATTASRLLQNQDLFFNDDGQFQNYFAVTGAQVDLFTAVWLGQYTPSTAGTTTFGIPRNDDRAAVWLDANQNGTFESGERLTDLDCCDQNKTGTTPALVAGQKYNLLIGVQDTGGGSGLRATIATPTIGTSNINPGVQINLFSYISDNGAGSSFTIDDNAEMRVKSFDGVTTINVGNASNFTLSNKASSTASSADTIKLVSSASPFAAATGTVYLGDKNVLTVGELVLGGAGTLNIDQPAGSSTGGRLVVTGNVTGFTGINSDIQGSTINVNGATFITNTNINGIGLVNASLLGTIGGNGSINMPINIVGSGNLNPGDPGSNGGIGHLTTGQLTENGNLTIDLLNSGTTPSPNYDQLSVNGIVDITNATLTVNLAPGFTASPGDTFKILLNDSNDGVFGTFAQGSSITVGASTFNIVYNADYDGSGGGNDIGLVYVVPEPGTLAILLGGFGTLVGLRRARRRMS